jgi:hypothetical protein
MSNLRELYSNVGSRLRRRFIGGTLKNISADAFVTKLLSNEDFSLDMSDNEIRQYIENNYGDLPEDIVLEILTSVVRRPYLNEMKIAIRTLEDVRDFQRELDGLTVDPEYENFSDPTTHQRYFNELLKNDDDFVNYVDYMYSHFQDLRPPFYESPNYIALFNTIENHLENINPNERGYEHIIFYFVNIFGMQNAGLNQIRSIADGFETAIRERIEELQEQMADLRPRSL